MINVMVMGMCIILRSWMDIAEEGGRYRMGNRFWTAMLQSMFWLSCRCHDDIFVVLVCAHSYGLPIYLVWISGILKWEGLEGRKGNCEWQTGHMVTDRSYGWYRHDVVSSQISRLVGRHNLPLLKGERRGFIYVWKWSHECNKRGCPTVNAGEQLW